MIAKAYIYYNGCHRDFENRFMIDNEFWTDSGFHVNVLQKVYCDYEDFFMVDIDIFAGMQPVEEYFVFVINDDNVCATVSIVNNVPQLPRDCEEYIMKLPQIYHQDVQVCFQTKKTVLDSITSMFYRTINGIFHYSNVDLKRNDNLMLEQILVY